MLSQPKKYADFFTADTDIDEALGRAVEILDVEEFDELFQKPNLAMRKCHLEEKIRNTITDLNGCKAHIKVFQTCFNENNHAPLKKVFKIAMKYAKEAEDYLSLKELVFEYKVLFGDFEEIKDFASDCNIVYELANDHNSFRTELKPYCLSCMKSIADFEYYLNIYSDREEAVENFIKILDSASELEKFYEKYGDPGHYVELKHYTLIKTINSGEWHLNTFPNCEKRLELLEKMVRMASLKKEKALLEKYLAAYLNEGGDESVIGQLFYDCLHLYEFLRNNPQFKNRLKDACHSCLTGETAALHKALYPEDTEIVERLIAQNTLSESINSVSRVGLFKSLNISAESSNLVEFDVTEYSAPVIILVGNFSDLPIRITDGISVIDVITDAQNSPITVVDKSYLSGQKIVLEFENEGMTDKHVEIAIYDLPKGMTIPHIKKTLEHRKSQKIFTKLARELLDNNIFKEKSVRVILGNYLKETLEPLPEKDIQNIAVAIQQRISEIFEFIEAKSAIQPRV